MKDAVVFDLDSTLIDVDDILHHIIPTHPCNETGRKDFDAFHRKSVDCPPNKHVVEAAQRAHKKGLAVIILTGRKEKYRKESKAWLSWNEVPHDQLIMRKNDDHRPAEHFKFSVVSALRAHLLYDVIEAWDDSPEVLEMYRLVPIASVVTVPRSHTFQTVAEERRAA